MTRDSSPAYRALSPSARTVLGFIDRQVERGGGVATISYSDIEFLCGVTHGNCGFALRQVRLLGFVNVELAFARSRHVNTFTMADGWRNLDGDEAHRLAVRARLPLSRPLRMPKPRTPKQQPSLAHITLGD
jgi:hypothetical protein